MNLNENNILTEMLDRRRAVWEKLELEKIKQKGIVPKTDKWKSKYKEPSIININNLSALPVKWVWASVSQIGLVISGQTPKGISDIKKEGDVPWFKVGDMNREGNEVNIHKAETYLTRDQLQELKLHVQPEGTIIFPKRGGAILTNKKRILAQRSAYDLNTMGIYPVGVEKKYLWYWFQSINLGSLADGSNVPQINHGDIEPLPVPVAPPEQQKRIVTKIEELFSHIDAGIEALKKAKQLLKQFRQSVLKAAVTGELTKDLPCRQAGWCDTSFRNISDKRVPEKSNAYFAYVLECEDGSLYKGYTEDLFSRINRHLEGQGAKWTQEHKPVALIHFEEFDTGKEAVKREKYYKSGSGREWVNDIRNQQKKKHEPATQLLERILKERRQKWEEQQLEQFKAKGKMPKDDKWKGKYKEPVHNVVKFFEEPDGWAWSEIGTITDMLSGHAFKKAEYTDAGVRLFQIANVSFGYTKWDEVEHLPESYLKEL